MARIRIEDLDPREPQDPSAIVGGGYFQPEVDDVVLVQFSSGDVRSPYVIGSLWNSNDRPPESK